jgi:hypothetical protein
MATWVGTFVSNIDGKSVRELEVEADDEVTAIVRLDFYEYDKSWQHYSFVDVRKKWNCSAIASFLQPLFTVINSLKLPGSRNRKIPQA